jgi:hypothetical protein
MAARAEGDVRASASTRRPPGVSAAAGPVDYRQRPQGGVPGLLVLLSRKYH